MQTTGISALVVGGTGGLGAATVRISRDTNDPCAGVAEVCELTVVAA